MLHKKIALAVFAFLFLGITQANAQVQTQTVTLRTGSVFEILVDGTDTSRQTGWILKKDNEFMQAERNAVFQTRFAQAGTYQLEAQSTTNDATTQLVLTIVVQDDPPQIPVTANDKDLLGTAEISKDNGGMLLFVRNNRTDIQQLLMDTNMKIDTSGDGDLVNDNALRGTFLASGTGEMFLWIPTLNNEQTILIGARLADSSIATQQIVVGDAVVSTEPDSPATGGNATIEAEKKGNGTLQFYLNVQESAVQSVPFIALWEFGDGSQSMLDAPEHVYAADGTYNVQVTLRSLQDGTILTQEQTTVILQPDDVPTVPVDDTKPAPEEPKPNTSDTKDGSLLGTIFTALGLLIVSLGIGALIVFLLAKFREKDLHEHFASAEEKLVNSPTPSTDDVPPMEMPVDDVIDAEVVPEEPTDDVVTEEVKVPSWLATAEETTTPAPPPVAVEEPETPAAPAADAATVPDWLKPKPTTAAEPPAPPSEPAVETKAPETTPPPSEKVTPPWLQPKTEAAPEPKKEDVAPATQEKVTPPWLQKNTDDSASVPTTSPAPTPTPPPPPAERVTPPWLQQQNVVPTVESTTPSSSPAPDSSPEKAAPPQVTEVAADTPKSAEELAKEEKERERRRRKRQRYRQNKKAREELETVNQATETQEQKPTDPSPATVPEPNPEIPTTPKQMDIPPADDGEVKFVISADSVEEANQDDSADEKKA